MHVQTANEGRGLPCLVCPCTAAPKVECDTCHRHVCSFCALGWFDAGDVLRHTCRECVAAARLTVRGLRRAAAGGN